MAKRALFDTTDPVAKNKSNLSISETSSQQEPLSPSQIEMATIKVNVRALLTGLSPMREKHFISELVDEDKSYVLLVSTQLNICDLMLSSTTSNRPP